MKTDTKHCKRCDTTKTVDQFYKDKSSKDGLQFKCKACVKAYSEANSEEIAIYKKAHYAANREAVRAKHKAYYQENKEVLKERSAEYKRNRLADDPTFRRVGNIRSNLRGILRGTGSHQPTLDLLGCTGPEWRVHLESLWTEGMSWDLYGKGDGKWEIDHVLPVSSFDQSDLEQRKICWHFSNTQPLWHVDNVRKGDTIPTESTNE
jgi:hypothetical protein